MDRIVMAKTSYSSTCCRV